MVYPYADWSTAWGCRGYSRTLLWRRGYASNAAGDSVHVGLTPSSNPPAFQSTTVTGFAPGQWSWATTTFSGTPAVLPITTTGLYTLSLWIREDGLRLDRLLLTTDTTYLPAGFGPAETARQVADAPGLLTNLDRVIEYDYDNLYHLTNAAYSSGESYQYGYDPVGNRLQQIINGDTTDYQYDAANRLEQVTVASQSPVSYSFDANGNLLHSDTLTNTWDAANRLIETIRQTDQTTNRLTPVYNGVGDRVGQTVGLTTTTFALDAVGGLPEVIYTSEGNTYLHLPGVIMTESAEGEVRYLLSDGLGSIRQAVDDSGAVRGYNEYDPYGNPTPTTQSLTPYGFTGEWGEGYTELLHLRARWYAPEIGAFLSRDAVEGEPAYAYVRGNPINLTDPSGMLPTRDGVENGDYSYSCNCGWIDWGHANGEFAWGLMDKLESLNSETEIDISAVAFTRFWFQGVVTLWISKKPNLPPNELLRTALGIFKEIEFQVEELQGSIQIGPVQLGTNTYFSEDDLPSDLIGFYRAVWERRGAHPSLVTGIIWQACNVLNIQDSLEVYDAYYNELPQGDMGQGGFVRWRDWQGRLADSCVIRGKCGDIANRRWPTVLSSIKEIPQGDTWHVEVGKTCFSRGVQGCSIPIPK